MSARTSRELDDVRRRWVPDQRLGVFDVEATADRISGRTTSREALAALRKVAAESRLDVDVTLLPDASVDEANMAVVTAAVAPLLDHPQVTAPRVNEALHGEPLSLLERRGEWLRVRGPDGYVAWTHTGYVALGSNEWIEDWLGRGTLRCLGAELEHLGTRLRLPIGARLAPRRDGLVETADGRLARISSGVMRVETELHAEARLMAAPELALRWFGGAPYVWGGRTEWGIDCSGLVQAVAAARGVPLPRDSDQQFGVGADIALSTSGSAYRAGDLLFFAEQGRVTHVALWAGGGRIVHSTLARGGVVSEDLFSDVPRLVRLRELLVGVRRLDSGR